MEEDAEANRVFQAAADLFGLLAAPVRVKIINAVCRGERSEDDLVAGFDGPASELAWHLGMLQTAGVLARRAEGARVFYRLQGSQVAEVCRTVCLQVASGLGDVPAAGACPTP